jgi:uncharacterized membrane protein YeaQ/YmgE (transglycosylase-associated protein family)
MTVMVFFIVALLVLGLVVGALGRLAIPGPNPMSLLGTIAIGIGGALLGGILGLVLFHRPAGLILSVVAAAFLVLLIDREEPVA